MIVVVGLGNPGKIHLQNRHNTGYLAVDKLANKIGEKDWSEVKKFKALLIKKDDLILLKPTVYMNSSGDSVRKIVNQYNIKPPNLWVIHDDLDIRLGDYKIQKGKGPRLHKGLKSIYEGVGSKDFWHVRVGVDERAKDNKIPGETYVLRDFSNEQMVVLENTLDKMIGRLIKLIQENGN